MGISKASLSGLRVFAPDSLLANDLDFLETLKFETSDLRKQNSIDKDILLERAIARSKSVRPKKRYPARKSEQKKLLEDFCQKLDKTLNVKNNESSLDEIKWDRIDEFCNALRRIERSDDRKVRWALYFIWRSGKSTIPIKDISNILQGFKIKDVSKSIKKILKRETSSGLVADFGEKILKINHDIDDRLVWHYLVDEIEEASRRSPGEIEKEILELIDEGSYSATEISDVLSTDEATVSRTLAKLRRSEKIILSSFGQRGARYFTTNCENCPFGTTKPACRKDALSYIIDYFKTSFGVELSSTDFDGIEENQALLKIKRIIKEAKKEKNTKLERSINSGLAELFGTIIDKSINIRYEKAKSPEDVKMIADDQLIRLPVLFHLGLYKGAQTSLELINEIMKTSKGISKEDRMKIKELVEKHPKKFLHYAGIEKEF